jgi:hypothetical protein
MTLPFKDHRMVLPQACQNPLEDYLVGMRELRQSDVMAGL